MAAGRGDIVVDEGCRTMLPRRSLAGCISAAVVGDTRGLALVPQERVNYFPATPFCAVSLFFEGQSIMAEDWGPAGVHGVMPRALPALVFSGPQGGPTVSVNPGPVHAMSIGFYPEAARELLGVDVAGCRDLVLPADAVLAPALLGLFEAARRTGDADQAFACIEDGLDPLWRSTGPRWNATSRWLSDWMRHLLLSAATSGAGQSLRQVERRMKSWTGQTRRDLATLDRLEGAFAEMMRRVADDRENWAELAFANGFSDQPHLVREVRRVTGLPPAQLRRRIRTDRAFWYYRLIGELY